jgi:glycosyltransferase involved in cell wall biosynthesis
MGPLKILQIVHNFPPYNFAGTEVYTYHLSVELAKRNNVFIFYRMNDREKTEFEITRREQQGLRIYAINNTFRDCDSFEMVYDNEAITDQFVELLEEINPDVVHIQHLLFLSIGLIEAIKKKGVPIVFTLHDYWLLCPQGQLFRNNLRVCREHTISDCAKCIQYQLSMKKGVMSLYWSLRDKLPLFLMRIIKNIYFTYARLSFSAEEEQRRQIRLRSERIKEACQKVDIFLAPSRFLRKKFIDFGIPEDKITFSRHGLRTVNVREPRRDQPGKIYLAFIGTLLPCKGAHVLIKAFHKLRRSDIELKIYGRETVYKGLEYYLKYIKKIGKDQFIHFMGGYNNEDLGQILEGIDILVVPSLWYENSPLVIQEAFLSQIPVIASRVGGIPELVKDGVNGLLFNAGDIKDLKEKLEYIIAKPGIIKKFKGNMPEIKTIEENKREIEEIYKSLVMKGRICNTVH